MLDLQPSTIVFQIINFLILLFILTRFLYQPVQRTMKQRQEAITLRLREASQREADAIAERERLEQQERTARADAERVLAEARVEADAQRARMIEAAREQVTHLKESTERDIRERERSALASTAAHLRATAASLAATLIRQAAGPEVHEALVRRVIAAGLPSAVREDAELIVELAYPAGPDLQKELAQLTGAHVTFRVNPELVAGVRILTSHQVVVELSVSDTLEQLQSRTNGLAA